MKTYYKVIYKDDSAELVSAVVEEKAQTIYKIGEFVEAPKWLAKSGYHLLVFDNLEDAKKFGTFNIFKCECKDEIRPLPRVLLLGGIEKGQIFTSSISPNNWPPGSRMFKKVKLLEEVKW